MNSKQPKMGTLGQILITRSAPNRDRTASAGMNYGTRTGVPVHMSGTVEMTDRC